ncbi:hypothetical protein CPB86DRAFT_452157 [Serendipita vermifera]|nr:hypothetical protein CPB86DRAFT_452157 [Serendipita vermifera]
MGSPSTSQVVYPLLCSTRGSLLLPGPAIWVQGVVLGGNWRDRDMPNVSFTLDGVESSMQTVETNDQDDILYNVTLFQASNLSSKEHTLCIQTHDNSSFLLDSIIFTSPSSLAAAVNETTATITDSPESTFPYNELPPSQSPNAVVVGGVIGGIFGAFLLAGVVGLLILRRSRRKGGSRGSSGRRRGTAGRKPKPGGGKHSNSSGSSGRKNQERAQKGYRPRGDSDAAVLEYEFASPRAVHMSPKNSVPQSQTGSGFRSAIDTFLGSTRSQTSSGPGGGGSFVHALTTDTPQLAVPQPSEWGKRPKGGMSRQEKHFSTQTQGSTLEADNVLEGMMNSSATPDYSTTLHVNMLGNHPFSAQSAHR